MYEDIIIFEEAPEGTPVSQYVPLHVYSDYSINQSIAKIKDLVQRAKLLNMKSLALTDDTLAGSLYFYQLCIANKIKPIIGQRINFGSAGAILLCKDFEAYKILCRHSKELSCHNKPVSELNLTKEECSHFICISEEYRDDYLWNLFGDNFYAEMLYYTISEEFLNNLDKSKAVVTNPVTFMNREDVALLNAFNEYQYGVKEQRNPYDYFISETELRPKLEEFDCKELLENTSKIAEQIEYIFPDNYFNPDQCMRRMKESLPSASEITSCGNANSKEIFNLAVMEGAAKRFETLTEEIKDRLNHEIEDITSQGWENIFLMHKTIIDKCNEKGIIHGPGRGSAPSSLVSYVLGITNVNPIESNLIYERFYNSERNTYPDIDIDYEYDRYDEVVQIIKETYGEERVAGVAAYGRFGSSTAMQIAGKALGYSKKDLDYFNSLWPSSLSITRTIKILKINDEEEIESLFESKEKADLLNIALCDKKYKKLVEQALKIEDVFHCQNLHASGYVITKKSVNEYIPVEEKVIDGKKVQFTSCSMNWLDSYGLYKNDLLGLMTLSRFQKIIKKVEETQNIHVDLNNIPLDDELMLKLFQSADTDDVFLFESPGMKNLLEAAHPEKFSDLVTLVSLYRPGTMGLIPEYLDNRMSEEEHHSVFYDYADILDETYDVMIYQEQLMQLVSRISGCSFAQADLTRRSMGKRRPDDLAEKKTAFIDGAKSKGITEEKADSLFEGLLPNSCILFNKSHAVAYTKIAWWDAYLKAHYAKEYEEVVKEEKIKMTNLNEVVYGYNGLKYSLQELRELCPSNSDIRKIKQDERILY